MSLILLNFLIFLLMLIIKLAVFVGLLKLFNKKSKIATIIKGFFIYEAVIFILTWFYYPASVFGGHISSQVGLIRALSFIIVSGSVFLIIVRRLNLLSWVRGIVLFLLMLIIVSHVVGFYVPRLMFGIFGDSVISNTNISDIFNNPFQRIAPFSLTRIVSQFNEGIVGGGVVYDLLPF